MITLHTSHGDIKIELDVENTPNTAKNFLEYATEGFYNGTIFHRVMNGFMIQGGGFDTDMNQKKVKETIKHEGKKGQENKRGTIAMARTSDPHSATAQFFINVVDNDFLNFTAESGSAWGYCVFGKVVDGMDVVDKIKNVATSTKNGHQNVPVDNVVIETVEVAE
ncbi:MAG: peptidylprolyl isomerase [Gammaproteobacteria bacterium]